MDKMALNGINFVVKTKRSGSLSVRKANQTGLLANIFGYEVAVSGGMLSVDNSEIGVVFAGNTVEIDSENVLIY